MPGLSVHVIDVTRGRPAQGMSVELVRVDGSSRMVLDRGQVGPDGAAAFSSGAGSALARGTYEVLLGVGAFYRALGEAVGTPAFQETAAYRFNVVDPAEHYHLPVKLSPWGLAIWRGR